MAEYMRPFSSVTHSTSGTRDTCTGDTTRFRRGILYAVLWPLKANTQALFTEFYDKAPKSTTLNYAVVAQVCHKEGQAGKYINTCLIDQDSYLNYHRVPQAKLVLEMLDKASDVYTPTGDTLLPSQIP